MARYHDLPTQEECSYLVKPKPSFGITASTKQGDGKWCPGCRAQGVYTWLDFGFKTNRGVEVYELCRFKHIHKE